MASRFSHRSKGAVKLARYSKIKVKRACSSLLDIGRRPEFAERTRPAAVDDTLSSGDAHAFPQCGIGNQRPNSAREVIDITRLGDKTIGFVFYQLFRPAGIGNDDWHAGGLRFDDDVAERVSRNRR